MTVFRIIGFALAAFGVLASVFPSGFSFLVDGAVPKQWLLVAVEAVVMAVALGCNDFMKWHRNNRFPAMPTTDLRFRGCERNPPG